MYKAEGAASTTLAGTLPPLPTQNSEITGRFMNYIVKKLVPNLAPHWENVGIYMGVEGTDSIRRNQNHDPKKCCQAMFIKICNSGAKTFGDLINALDSADLKREAQNLRDELPEGEPVKHTPVVKTEVTKLPGYDQQLDLSHLAILTHYNQKLSSHWENLAYHLGVPHSRVMTLSRDTNDSEEAMQKTWEAWLEQGSERSVLHLIRALETIGQGRMASIINRHCERPYPGDIKPLPYTLPRTEFGEEHKVALFSLLPSAVLSKWDELLFPLGFDFSTGETIKKDCGGNMQRSCYELLSRWIDKGGATVERFVCALQDCELNGPAEDFKKSIEEGRRKLGHS